MHTYTHKHWFGLEPRHMEGLLYQFFIYFFNLAVFEFQGYPFKKIVYFLCKQ